MFQLNLKAKHRRAILDAKTLAVIASIALVPFSLPLAAQPNIPSTEKATDKPGFVLEPEKRETFRKFVDLSTMETSCKRQISLKVTNATLDEVITTVKVAFPAKTRIEVRDARPIHVSCDLRATTAGEALQSAGSLAGCKFWIFDDHLLLSPSESLTATESKNVEEQIGGEWQRNVAAGGSGWYAQSKGGSALLETIVEMFDQRRLQTNATTVPGLTNQNAATTTQAQGDAAPTTPEAGNKPPQPKPKPLEVTFGELSPDAQAVFTQLVAWNNENSSRNPFYQPLILAPNTKITFDDSTEKHVSLRVLPQADDSNSRPPLMGWGFKRQ